MNMRFRLICLASVVTLGWSAEIADAQIVTITKTGYVAANGNNPPKADPQGTWSVPSAGDWKVIWDYGTVNNGVFTPDGTIGAGGTKSFTIAGGGNGTWGPTGAENLKNPLPANTNVWAQLWKKNAQGVYVQQGAPAYAPLPNPGGE